MAGPLDEDEAREIENQFADIERNNEGDPKIDRTEDTIEFALNHAAEKESQLGQSEQPELKHTAESASAELDSTHECFYCEKDFTKRESLASGVPDLYATTYCSKPCYELDLAGMLSDQES